MPRPSSAVEAREVSPLELFYDLVFVFAVSQLSEHLLHDLTWRGAARTLVLLCTVFTVWLLTAFEAVAPGTRLWWWGAATVIDLIGVWLAHPWPFQRMPSHEIAFDYAHMAERLRLVVCAIPAVLPRGRRTSRRRSLLRP
jgi:low temperature requirement protein LtrA